MKSNSKKIVCTLLVFFVFYTLADELFSFYKKQGLAYKSISKVFRTVRNSQTEQQFKKAKKNPPPQTKYLENRFLIAHAFGEIEGFAYTNSLEAFQKNYAGGHRIFEVDFSLTSDGRLVACHDWDYFNLISDTSGILSYAEFKNAKIYEKFSPLAIEDIIELMKQYPDFFIVTDKFFPGEEKAMLEKLLFACDYDEQLLQRFVIQVYSDKNFLAIDKIHHFENYIYTLYVRGKDDLEQNAKFCVIHKIPVVTMWDTWATSGVTKIYNEFGIKIFAHTVNDESKFQKLQRWGGVYGIYTDSILPKPENFFFTEERIK